MKSYKVGDRQFVQRGGEHVSTIEARNAALKDIAESMGVIQGKNNAGSYLAYIRMNPETFFDEILTQPIILNI